MKLLFFEDKHLQGGVIVTNSCDDTTSISAQVSLYSPDFLLPPLQSLPTLAPGQSTTINLPPLTFNSPGSTFIHSQIYDCTDIVNILVLSDSADLSLANVFIDNECTRTITAQIRNGGGIPSGNFNVKLSVFKGINLVTTLYQPIVNINPLQTDFASFNYLPPDSNIYTFSIDVDYLDNVSENNEFNNTNSVIKYITPCRPDLVIGHCGFIYVQPENVVQSDFVNVTATIFNKGFATANGPFQIKFDTGDSAFYYTFVHQLLPNSAQQISLSIKLPSSVQAILKISVDYGNAIIESDENNTITDSIFYDFSLMRLPNTPNGSEMFWDHTQLTFHPFIMSVGLLNKGLLDASHLKVLFEVSGPGLSGWVKLDSANVYSQNYRLTDDQSTCLQNILQVQMPGNYAFQQPGIFQVRLTADYGNAYPERNENNNVLIVDVVVSNFSDYRLLSQYIAPSTINPEINDPVTFDLTYENIGRDDGDSLELSISGDNSVFDSLTVPGLLGSYYSTVHFSNSWSSSLPGVHVIRAIVDNDAYIDEVDEQNNEATRAIFVGPTPNLRFQSFTISNPSPGIGTLNHINAVIQNTGKMRCTATYQLTYIDNYNSEILIHQQLITVDSVSSIPISIPWIVADSRTIITGKILNCVPIEYELSDNIATISLGAIHLSTTGSYASCATNNLGISRVFISGGQPPYFIQWSNGRSSDTIQAVPGIYTATVTDMEGSSASITDTILTDPFIFENCGNGIDDNCNGITDENCNVNLNLKVFIEGFYLGNGSMVASVDPIGSPLQCDTLIIELHNTNYPYYTLCFYKGLINIFGNGNFLFPDNVQGLSFYLVVRHRNAIETWSSAPVLFNDLNMNYDFTGSANKAFGNNMRNLGDGNFAIWSGDISDATTGTIGKQDGIVESQDYSDIENAVYFTLLGYIPEDITGDRIVESEDYSLMENNVHFTIVSIRP